MSDSRDPAIKLFGRTIPLPPILETSAGSSGGEEKDLQSKEDGPESVDKDHESPESEGIIEPPTAHESPKPSAADQESAPVEGSKPEEPSDEISNSQEKTLKKPDKILPCPRCNSMDTKFCYYNNYNVNQPRHFCKNCQRYWTAGGTMRNVPVGAGRRKNKNSAPTHYRHIAMADACLQTIRPDIIPQPIHHPPAKPNGTVLSFGSDVPLCESMASALNLADKGMKNGHGKGFRRMEEKAILFACGAENANEQSSGSSVTPSSSNDEGSRAHLQEPRIENPEGIPAPIPCFNGSPWPYPWTPAPAFCTSSFPFPLYPATAYWGCTVPGTWTIPWLSPVAASPPKSDSSGSGPNSANLGKHSREGEKGNDVKRTKQESCLWIPKTLRIDNPDEAAKSSIWTMVGIKNDKTDATGGGGLFKAFQPKADMKNHRAEASQVLHANPAALSRSLSFQESS